MPHTKMLQISSIYQEFQNRYGKTVSPRVFFCPGRINIIGEHLDYNGGLVLPMTIDLGIHLLILPNQSKKIRVASLDQSGEGVISLDSDLSKPEGNWTDYPRGVVYHLLMEGAKIDGANLLYASDLPIGAGLSSSAALEMVTAYALLKLSLLKDGRRRVNFIDLAKLCRRTENEYLKIQSGIMDQFAVAMGSADYCILLDGDSLSYRYVSFQHPGFSLVVMDTRKQRTLKDSPFNKRRLECHEVFKLISAAEPIKTLAQATHSQIDKYVADPTLKKRGRHVVSEQERVKKTAAALESGDLKKLGEFLKESQISLRDDFEVTGEELDAIVEAAWNLPECLAARMNGAGFGGCAFAIVADEYVDRFKTTVADQYRRKVRVDPIIVRVNSCDGVREIHDSSHADLR